MHTPSTTRRALRRAAAASFSAAALIAGVLAAAAPAGAAATSDSPAAVHVKRLCAAPAHVDQMSCLALARTDVTQPQALVLNAVSPLATPSGYGPTDLRSAYALPANGGTGATVAIVDAQDDPNAAADLSAYRAQYGLSACTTANGCFKKVSQTGSTTSLPSPDSGWAGEISLDLDMVSAVAPNAHILLVEATSANMDDLGAAVNEAVALGAKYVSNSYGGDEDSTDASSDSSYFNHPGVAITVSSGDEAYGAEYPAASKYVTSVGGTSLRTSSTTRGWTESVWKTSSTEGGGSGCSAFDAKPTWQTDTGCSRRTIADVSAVADPATGVAVYDTYGASGWQVYGGTSASSPIIAAVYADAGTPAAGTYPAQYPYQHTSALNDVTTGNNGSCSPTYLCTAGVGYDGPTGLGTPAGVSAFAGGSGGGTGGNTVSVTAPGNQSGATGTAVSLQIHATDSASGQTLSYSASGLPAGLSISSAGLISGTPTTAGSYSVTVSAQDTTGATGSTSFTWTVTGSGGGGGGCSATQLLGNPGFETGTASPWTASTGVLDNTTAEPAHSGSWKAWLNGYGTTHTDTLSQSVTIPASCTGATLTFWLHIDTSETTTSTAYDTLKVQATTSGGAATTLATYSNLNHNTGYAQRTLSLTPYVGSTVTLKFTGTEDSSLQTSFVIDDTSVTGS